MGQIFDILYKKRNKNRIKKSEEIAFFNKYKRLLIDSNVFSSYADNENIFDIIKANIFIQGLINKNTLDLIIGEEVLNKNFNTKEKISENIIEKCKELPFIDVGKEKIYIPFFNIATNKIYAEEFYLMTKKPYSSLKKDYSAYIIDPFDTYNIKIYDSPFTKFVKAYEYNKSVAFYHYDLDIVFVINEQGYLDTMICLFDKYIKKVNREHLMERLNKVIKYYFNNDLTNFVYSMYDENFISYKVFKKLCKIKRI